MAPSAGPIKLYPQAVVECDAGKGRRGNASQVLPSCTVSGALVWCMHALKAALRGRFLFFKDRLA